MGTREELHKYIEMCYALAYELAERDNGTIAVTREQLENYLLILDANKDQVTVSLNPYRKAVEWIEWAEAKVEGERDGD